MMRWLEERISMKFNFSVCFLISSKLHDMIELWMCKGGASSSSPTQTRAKQKKKKLKIIFFTSWHDTQRHRKIPSRRFEFVSEKMNFEMEKLRKMLTQIQPMIMRFTWAAAPLRKEKLIALLTARNFPRQSLTPSEVIAYAFKRRLKAAKEHFVQKFPDEWKMQTFLSVCTFNWTWSHWKNVLVEDNVRVAKMECK